MRRDILEQMVQAVRKGYTARSVFETSLTWHPGSSVRINKDTTGKLINDGGDVAIPKGSVVTVVGVGGGESGKDTLCLLPSGQQATIPFYDLGEGVLRRKGKKLKEEPEPGTEDDPKPDEDDPDHEEGASDKDDEEDGSDDERIVRVELTKPLSAEAEDWLKGGYKEEDHGAELPDQPEDDQPDSMKFLMKAKDETALGSAIGALKKVAGENLVKIEPASKEEWKRN